MRIINADLMLRHMKEHNWASLNREQIEGFVQDMDIQELNQYVEGYLDALEDASWNLVEKRTNVLKIIRACCSCRWWANAEEVCCCEESERCAHFTRKYEVCEHWEKDKKL